MLLLVGVLALALTGCVGAPPEPRLWGAFTERGLSNMPMKPGMNVRVFNDVNMDAHGYIKYDKSNGRLTLQPGTYRIDGWSLTLFGFQLTPQQQAATYSAPGYAFFWNADEKKAEILGSLQDPLYAQKSIINGILTVRKTTRAPALTPEPWQDDELLLRPSKWHQARWDQAGDLRPRHQDPGRPEFDRSRVRATGCRTVLVTPQERR
ncbi:hypothetical protein [Mycobacterium sp. 012931]|uniref:hypothetical protein n=1 Tax=Mycobacterium sp. 012931 TaxID=1187065 RepID=UPI000424A850|nr:hypothetical protein [Mycobacterium sp. 012931]